MSKRFVWVVFILTLMSAWLQAQNDQQLYEKAKVLIFDKKWHDALVVLEEGAAKYPQSSLYSSFIFYKGKCLEELGLAREALQAYEQYVRSGDNESLKEEAQSSIIDLAFSLYQRGETAYLERLTAYLKVPTKALQYYAAYKLSFLEDKKKAALALPVLKRWLTSESNPELRDRAKIAILRIDPDVLNDPALQTHETSGSILKYRVVPKNKKEASVTINVPLDLADLALKALSDETRQALKKEGYDVDKILRRISERKGLILRIDAEDALIEIIVE